MKIVIAKYLEDVSWINQMDGYDIFIINKNPQEYGKYQMDLPNEGRESHTYLNYIIKYYDELDEYTCFLQGKPFDHLVESRTDHSFFLNLIKNFKYDRDFIGLGDLHTETVNPPSVREARFDLLKDIIINIPSEKITFNCSGQFIVSKKNIHKHTKDFYVELLKRHYMFWEIPWTLERLWGVIFSSCE
jgi:hypothetical protein